MVTKGNRYDLFARLLPIHRPDRRNKALTPAANEWAFPNITVIRLPENADKVVRTAALDFVDYLITSMNVSACLTFEQEGFAHVNVSIDSDVPGPIGYRITTSTDGVMLVGSDPRGAARELEHCLVVDRRRNSRHFYASCCSRIFLSVS